MTNSTIVLAILGYIAVLVVSIVVIYRIIGREQKPADAHGAAVDEQAARFLKERCAELELKNAQRTLLLDLVTAVTRSGTFDDLAKNTVDSLCTLLRTGMAGLLWKCAGEEKLEFKYVRGYTGTAALRIPLRASLAGLSILRREPLFVSGPRNDVMYVPIPSNAENNVLCLPLPMFGEYRGVLRVANISPEAFPLKELVATLTPFIPVISSALEKTLISQENERRKNELAAVSGITQALHRTLDLREICAACARHLKTVFDYTHFELVRFTDEENLAVMFAVPREIKFTEAAATSRIILRNVCSSREPVLIDDVRTHEKVRSENRELRSLISVPFNVGGRSFGAVVLASGRDATFDSDDLTRLALFSEHIALTIERAIYFRQQEDQASRDGLTGLYNHRIFQERIRGEVQRFFRYKRPFSLLLLDIDHFKKCNDTHGHQAGDLVLKAVAQCIMSTMRTTDMAFRYGGEEFCCILPETTLEQAGIYATRLAAAIRGTVVNAGQAAVSVTASIGVAQVAQAMAGNALVEAADASMYAAKNSGRDRVCIFKNDKPEIFSTSGVARQPAKAPA